MRWAREAIVAAVVLGAMPATASAVSIVEFSNGIDGRPAGITLGPDNNLWVTEYTDNVNRVDRVTPDGGFTAQLTLPVGSDPYGITAGPDGDIWVTEYGGRKIREIPIAGNGSGTAIAVPGGGQPLEIISGPDGMLWYTDVTANVVRRLSTAMLHGTPIPLTASPRGIANGPDGNVWVSLSGDQVARITPGGVVTYFPLPANTEPDGITGGPDGNIWIAERPFEPPSTFLPGRLGRMAPTGPPVAEFVTPSPADVNAVTAGPDGHVWYTKFNSPVAFGRVAMDGTIKEFMTLSPNSSPNQITKGPGNTLWFTEFNGRRLARVTLDPAAATTGGASAVTPTGGSLLGTVDPNDYSTTYSFEYGTTSDYGQSTASQSAGDGADPLSVTADIANLQPDTLYHYRLVATNVIGTVRGADATFTTGPDPDRDDDGVPRPLDCDDDDPRRAPGKIDIPDNAIDEDCSGEPAINLDRDRDGANRPQDCDDANPAIRPGAVDVPGNKIDEDCSGRDAPFPELATTPSVAWKVFPRYTTVVRMRLEKLPRGAAVQVRCRGGGCRFKTKKARVRAGRADMRPLFRGTRLAGATVEIRVTAPAIVGKLFRYTVPRGKTPRRRILCIAPGQTKTARCPS